MLAPEISEIETAGLNQCHTCGAELLERDKFCRRCGVSQRLGAALSTRVTDSTNRPAYETRRLLSGENRGGSFSGTLVNVVTQSLAEEASVFRAKRWMLRMVGALVAVPLWLMIVVLSPLDAYVAAQAIIAKPGGQIC